MKLWILRPKEGATIIPNNPWHWKWDCTYGFVVRAENESDARQLAENRAGGETSGAWLDSEWATCLELLQDGDAEVVIEDVLNG